MLNIIKLITANKVPKEPRELTEVEILALQNCPKNFADVTTPSIEKRIAALESAIVDLALSNTEVVNNA